MAEIESVEATAEGVRLLRKRAASLDLRVTSRNATPELSAARTALESRLFAELERTSRARPELLASLAHGDGTAKGWLIALRQLMEQKHGYREAPLDEEELARVLDDPMVSGRVRVAAGVALMAKGDSSAKARVQAASLVAIDPALAAALTDVSEGRPEEGWRRALGM